MKRRTHPSGRKGQHGPEVVQPRRPSKYARYIHNHSAEHGDAEAFARAVKSGCILAGIISILLCLAAVAAHAQPIFQFYTTEVEMANDSGQMEAYNAVMAVYAVGDTATMLIPSTQSVAVQLTGLTWISDGLGGFDGVAANGRVKYRRGVDGQTAEIITGALWMVCREKSKRKISKL